MAIPRANSSIQNNNEKDLPYNSYKDNTLSYAKFIPLQLVMRTTVNQ